MTRFALPFSFLPLFFFSFACSSDVDLVLLPDAALLDALSARFAGRCEFGVDFRRQTLAVKKRDSVLRTCLPVRRFPGETLEMHSELTLENAVQFLNEALNVSRIDSAYAQFLQHLQRSVFRGNECARTNKPLTAENLLPYILSSQPVIFEGAANHSNVPPPRAWTNEKVWVKVAQAGSFEGIEHVSKWNSVLSKPLPKSIRDALPHDDLVCVRPYTWMTKLSTFLDALERPRPNSSASFYLQYFPDRFLQDAIPDPLDGLLDLSSRNVWLGDGKTVGKTHFDEFDNIMFVLKGEKRFRVFEPWDNRNMYEGHIREGTLGFHFESQTFFRDDLPEATCMVMSPIDIDKVDEARFPLFRNTHSLDCNVRETDALYLPSFWWHEVVSAPNRDDSVNLAVNFWYHPFRTKEFPCAKCPLELNEGRYSHLLQQLFFQRE